MTEYKSTAPGLQLIIRDQIINPVLSQPGRPYIEKPVLTVEFGQYGAEIRPTSQTGMTDEFGNAKKIANRHEFGNEIIYADFRGGFIDLEQMIADKKRDGLWDDEDAELVRRTLEDACDNPRSLFHGEIERYERPTPEAPWPTYDDMDAAGIAGFAQLAGLIGEAAFYEASTLNRPEVLEALQNKARQDTALVAE